MAEIRDIRQFQAHEFRPLLETESRVWGSTLRWDYTSSARLITSCLEERRLQGYALVSEGRIRGYSFFFYEGEKGLIGNLFVDPELSDPSWPIRLLERVIETLTAIPGVCRVETQLPHFSFEALNPCFLAHGFEGYARRFMAVSLARRAKNSSMVSNEPPKISTTPRPVLGDFVIDSWERKHDRAAAQLLLDTYRNHVDAVINDQYASEDGATRLVENIMHQRGCGEPLPKVSKIAVHRSTGRLAGVLALTSVRPRTAHIPQIAIAKEYQSIGLGTVILGLSFEELHKRGFEEVSLTVTDLNVGAVRLYERLGFENFRAFGAFVWKRRA